MTGFTRQQSYVDGDTILAEHSNDEFDLIQEAFDANTGHKHDGTIGGGAFINKVSDNDGDTYVQTESSSDIDQIELYAAGAKIATVDAGGLLMGDRFRIQYNPALDSLDFYAE